MIDQKLKIFSIAALIILFFIPEHVKAQPIKREFRSLHETSENYISLVNAVSSSVVQVRVEGFGSPGRDDTISRSFSRSVKSGSGVIVDSTGYIITNYHVVKGAKSVEVVLPYRESHNPEEESILHPQGEITDAKIVGTDKETDIAVLKIEAGPQPYLELDDSDEVKTGQLVLAFGSPLGLQNSVSMGIVSSTARQLRQEDPMIYIQTDAPINPGNSGGPLVNTEGKIIGINTLNLSQSGGSEGLGFAAPSNIVKDIYNQIKEIGRVRRGVIGLYAQTIGSRLTEGLNVPNGYRVVISDVYPGSPADFVGLKSGDIVKSMDGKFMENARQLNVNIYGKPIGSYISLTIIRDGQELKKKVRVVERADNVTRFMDLVDPEDNFIERLGVLAVDLSREIRQMLPPLRRREGVVIAGSNGKAEVLGDSFKPGDIIYTANEKTIGNINDFRKIVNQVPAGEVLVLHVERNGTLMYLSYRMD